MVGAGQNTRPIDIVLGMATLNRYERNTPYLGATIGRYANRINNAKFALKTRQGIQSDG